jgi:HK97 family phage portal protein
MASPLTTIREFLRPTPAEPVTKAQPMAIGVTTLGETSLKDAIGQPHDADFGILYGLYKYNTDISGSVHKWAGGITSPGWDLRLMDEDATPTDKQTKQMKDLKVWLRRPNPNKGMSSLLYTVVQHMAINGDAFWYVSRDSKNMPLEIWPMHPALVRIVATREGEVLGYIMRGPDGTKVPFQPDEVIHFQLPSPDSDIYGEGRVELAVEEAGIDLQALRSNKAIFTNGMNPSAVLLLDDKATPDDAKRLTSELRQGHAGADNRNKILALSRVVDFKPWSMTPKDLDFLGLRNLATEKVTTAMGVPQVLLGNHNAGDYATTKFLVRIMHQTVFMPVQEIIAEAITEHLIHSINPDFEWFLNKPDASDPDDLRKDQMAAKQGNILTADEVRKDGFGKDPLTDEQREEVKPPPPVIAPAANTPDEIDDVDSNKDTAPDELKDGDNAAKSLGHDHIHKAVAANSADDTDPIAQERYEEMEALAIALIDPLNEYFADQQDEYDRHLPDSLTEQNLDTYLNAPTAAMNANIALLLGSLIYPSLTAGIKSSQAQVESIADEDTKLKIDLTLRFDQTNPFVDHWIKNEAAQHVAGINQTTRDQLRAALLEGIRKGEGIPDLSQRIADVFKNARNYRTDMIARTETAQAYSYANKQTLDLMFAQGIINSRCWLTAKDERVCPICRPLNGVTIPFNGRYPGGYEPGYAHIQDRCTEIGLLEEANA